MLRLRQAVLVARDLDAVVADLRAHLPLADPFHDEGVGHFGLRNAVMALGDTFVEVVSPAQPDTAAGRQLDRLGADSGGYMIMFQVGDLAQARERIARLGIRVVWELELPDVTDLHLHPADVPGAIVALDRTDPPASWRWGGPAWEARAPETTGPGRVTGATLTARDPDALALRWASVLGADAAGRTIALDGGELRFAPGERDGIAAFHVEGTGADAVIGGVRFTAP
jgi:hypothetical protein